MEHTKSILSKKVFDFHRFHCINMVKGDQEILWLKKMIIKSANTSKWVWSDRVWETFYFVWHKIYINIPWQVLVTIEMQVGFLYFSPLNLSSLRFL